jgi:hypothetical protein
VALATGSKFINAVKDAIIGEIINSELMFKLIDSPDVTSFDESEKLIGTHIFRFGKNPTVIEKDITFITVEVNTDKSINSWTKIVPQITIKIYSHDSHMNLDTTIFPNVTANRNDYISEWFDNLINGKTKIGSFNLSSKLKLKRNHEYACAMPDWLMRTMIFEGEEMSIDLCAEMNRNVR